MTKEQIKALHLELNDIGHRKAEILNTLRNGQNNICDFLKEIIVNEFYKIKNKTYSMYITNITQRDFNNITVYYIDSNLNNNYCFLTINVNKDFEEYLEENFEKSNKEEFLLECKKNLNIRKEQFDRMNNALNDFKKTLELKEKEEE